MFQSQNPTFPFKTARKGSVVERERYCLRARNPATPCGLTSHAHNGVQRAAPDVPLRTAAPRLSELAVLVLLQLPTCAFYNVRPLSFSTMPQC